MKFVALAMALFAGAANAAGFEAGLSLHDLWWDSAGDSSAVGASAQVALMWRRFDVGIEAGGGGIDYGVSFARLRGDVFLNPEGPANLYAGLNAGWLNEFNDHGAPGNAWGGGGQVGVMFNREGIFKPAIEAGFSAPVITARQGDFGRSPLTVWFVSLRLLIGVPLH